MSNELTWEQEQDIAADELAQEAEQEAEIDEDDYAAAVAEWKLWHRE